MTDDTRNDDAKITDARSTDKESGEPQSTDASDTGNVVDINRWRDFNDAEPQRLDDAWPAHAVQSTDEIKARMLVHLRGVLSYLFPGGVFQRGKFFVGDIRGNPGDSLVVEIEGRKAGLWHDFATGEGGDIIGLWAAANGRDTKTEFPAIVADILAWLDGRPRTLHDERAGGPRRKTPSVDELGPVTAKWDYLDEAGRLIACVYRYDPPGGKQFRPWDVTARKARAPDPRPLYNRPVIETASDVVLVEGEKAAQALIGQGLCATTAMNGASAPVEKTDWSPLKARRVVVWPDHDEPGWHYALAVAQAVLAAGAAAVSVLNPPADKRREMGRGRRGGRGHGCGRVYRQRRAPGHPAREALVGPRRLACRPLRRRGARAAVSHRWLGPWPPFLVPDLRSWKKVNEFKGFGFLGLPYIYIYGCVSGTHTHIGPVVSGRTRTPHPIPPSSMTARRPNRRRNAVRLSAWRHRRSLATNQPATSRWRGSGKR